MGSCGILILNGNGTTISEVIPPETNSKSWFSKEAVHVRATTIEQLSNHATREQAK